MNGRTLLSREDFRRLVFERAKGYCEHCRIEPATAAHHIMERRLWPDGGYYLDNGFALCYICHKYAETTDLTTQAMWEILDVDPFLPPGLLWGAPYDKWGNRIIAEDCRAKGPLFSEELRRLINTTYQATQGKPHVRFLDLVKYPRTPHLPWSSGRTDDDRVLVDTYDFEGREVVVTEKVDGENTTLYGRTDDLPNGWVHARSFDSGHHESRSVVKALHSWILNDIPIGWRVCGENLRAAHSIYYPVVPESATWGRISFLLFGVYNDQNVCLSWDETEEWARLWDIPVVPVLYRGPWHEPTIAGLAHAPGLPEPVSELGGAPREGYVVRSAGAFYFEDFQVRVAKYVRPNHVGTDRRWMHGPMRQNGEG